MTFTTLSRRALMTLALTATSFATLAQDIPTLRVGWTIPGEESKYWMMKRPEAFPNLGKTYRIEWTQFQGTAPMVQAMLSNALDCASTAPLSFAQGVVNGKLDAYIVAQHLSESPNSFSVYWGVLDSSPLKTIADLKGKTIGVNVYGSGVQGGMSMILKKNGIDATKDVKVVETGFPGSEAALRGGRVDAAVFVQPFAQRAEAKGGIRKLFSQQELMPNAVQVMEMCKKDYADKNAEVVKAYVRDLTAAMKMAIDKREDTVKIVSEVTRAPAEALEPYLMKSNDFFHPADARPDFAAIQTMFDQFTEIGLITAPLKVDAFRRADLMAPIR